MSVTPGDAPLRPAYVRDAAGLYYKVGGGGGGVSVYAQAADPGTATTDIIWVDIDDTSLEEVEPVEPAATVAGTNRIINGDFSVNQRGLTEAGSVANNYGFDHWRASYYTGGGSPSMQYLVVATPGELPESAERYLRVYASGAGPSSNRTNVAQGIESVRTLSGKTVTASFWARAASGTPKIGLLLEQVLIGGGGSVTQAGVVTTSTTWTRYSITVDLPSLVGKTIAATDYLLFSFTLSSGASGGYPAVGIQSATFDIWGVQLEEGSTASPFGQKTYAEELRACQRYYYRRVGESTSGVFAAGYLATTTIALFYVQFPVPMRSSTPTFGSSAAGTFTANGAVLSAITAPVTSMSSMGVRIDATCQAGTVGAGTLLSVGNGSPTVYMDFSAELF